MLWSAPPRGGEGGLVLTPRQTLCRISRAPGRFCAPQAFQTSMFHGKNLKRLNHYCLAVLYFFLTFSCLFAPRVVATLGPRCAGAGTGPVLGRAPSPRSRSGPACRSVSMVLGAIPYVLVVVTNLHPDYWYSLPTYALLGVGAAVLWTAEGVRCGRTPSVHPPPPSH